MPDNTIPEQKPKRNPIRPWMLLLIVGAAVGIWMLRGQARKGQAGGNESQKSERNTKGGGRGSQPMPVAVAKARRGDIPVYQTGLGSVTAFYTVTVRSRVDGQLMRVLVKEGDFVREGQPLAQIDPRPFQVQLQQAEGQMARDQAQLQNARLDLARYQTLIAQDAIPRQQLDTQKATVQQFEGTVKQDEAAIANARLQITYANITAPISGRVGLRQVDPGNIVHASDANGLIVITQLQPITALFTIPEDSLQPVLKKLRAGSRLPVEAFNRDFTRKLDSGRLLTVDNQIDPQTGTSTMKAVFDNRAGTLFPNQFVNIRMLVDTERNQVIIPAVALQHGQQGTFVYVLKPDSTAEARPVTVGITVDETMSIRSGLSEGETVITEGTDKLQPGSPVRAREPNSTPRQRKGGGPPA